MRCRVSCNARAHTWLGQVSGVECLMENVPDACYTFLPPEHTPATPPASPGLPPAPSKSVMENPAGE